ncbi:putative terminase [Xenohaliotis phage pCXc-HC2016]|nr:putative terminase [Xenohaliotis phage pCXc-HC2016]AQW89128.1 putative terminase [Xenohaliotis phage pCXc-HR2015]
MAVKYYKYRYEPEKFISEILRIELFDWQKEVVSYVRDFFIKNRNEDHAVCRVAIVGGNGTGKTKLGLALLKWRFACFPSTKNFVLTNSVSQTMRTGFAALEHDIRDMFSNTIATDDKIYLSSKDGSIRTPAHWYIRYLTQSATESGISGMHEKMMTFVFDESTEFSYHVWNALENMTTQGTILCYCSGNPIATNNYFYEIFRNKKMRKNNDWYTREVSLLELPDSAVNKKIIQDRLERYGEHHQRYRGGILGKFEEAASNSRFPMSLITGATERNKTLLRNTWHPLVMGIDVAESAAHGSSSAICLRRGAVVEFISDYEVCYEQFHSVLMSMIAEHRPNVIAIDANGCGAGLSYELKRSPYILGNVVAVKLHSLPQEERFASRHSELAWRASVWLREQVYLPEKSSFIMPLSRVFFDDSGDKIKMQGKKDNMAARTRFDMVDAFFLTFENPSEATSSSPLFMQHFQKNRNMARKY